jgi:hypothetical protein
MRKVFAICLFTAAIMMSSCGPKPNAQGEYVIKTPNGDKELHIKYFPDGKLEYIREVKEGQPEGFFVNFFKNGNTDNTGRIKDGKKDGAGIMFYPNGRLKSAGEYKNDQQNGYFWLFDKDKNLVEKREYLIMNEKSRMNQWVKFNSLMEPLQAESNYIRLQAKKDTINQGDPYELSITLGASYNKEYMAVVIGPFDEAFQLPAHSQCDTLVAKNFTALYKTTQYKSGLNTLRGVVQDLSVSKDKAESKVRSIYFTREFAVNKRKQ